MKKVSYMLIISIVCILVLLFSGCNSNDGAKEDDRNVSLVIIAGRHANAKMYTVDMVNRARELINDSIVITSSPDGYTAKAQVAVIVSDGSPTKVPVQLNGKEDILFRKAPNRSMLQPEIEGIVDDIIEFLCSDELRADDPEVDLLNALNEARKELNTYPNSEPHILILDTGITTAGKLDMRFVNILEGECADIVEQISDGIPDLDGVKVTFLNLGNVAEPQSNLGSIPAEERLEKLWTAIIEDKAKGSLTEELHFSTNEGEPMRYYEIPSDNDPGYEFVSSVLFVTEDEKGIVPEEITIRKGKDRPPEIPSDEPFIESLLKTAHLGFKPNSAEFIDGKEQALVVLNAIRGSLEQFLNYKEKEYPIYVVGSIAKTEPDKCQKHDPISNDRAQKVANLLINDFGVPAERIITIDAGVTKFSWRNAEEFPDGSTNPNQDNQQQNRVVAIFGGNSLDLLQELKENDYIN